MDVIKFKSQLGLEEGYKTKPYTDTRGKITIGVGRNLSDVGLSHSEVDFLLQNDIDRVLGEVSARPWWKVVQDDDARARAILDMVFQLGLAGFEEFKATIGQIILKNWNTAAGHLEDSLWATQVPNRAAKIIYMIRTGMDP